MIDTNGWQHLPREVLQATRWRRRSAKVSTDPAPRVAVATATRALKRSSGSERRSCAVPPRKQEVE
eukprot:6182519-Pleurochrysis_carterae.AAC.8